MTREECIEVLKANYPSKCYEQLCEAVDVAIKALENPEQNVVAVVPCGDTISREDALMALTGEWTEPPDELIHRFIRRIRTLPSVNPQQKMGWWILTQRNKCIDICCSECGNTWIKDYAYGYTIDELNVDDINDMLTKNRINYCEGCGAKMQGVRK